VVGSILLLASAAIATIGIINVNKLGVALESSYEDSFLPFYVAEQINDAVDEMQPALVSGARRIRQLATNRYSVHSHSVSKS
jgi:hypothetical protein